MPKTAPNKIQVEVLGELEYTGYRDVAVYPDGRWISPADAARAARDDEDQVVIAVWDGEFYS